MVTKKETLIPPPGFKSPAPATARQSTSKFPLSAEVVGDGDDEQSDHVSTTSTSSGSDGEDETESQESSTSLEATSNRDEGLPSTASMSTRPPGAFRPPGGFQLVSNSTTESSVSELFSDANLRGKELWHVTAPGFVSLGSVSELSLNRLSKGETAALCDGTEYHFVQEHRHGQDSTLLRHHAAGDGYRAASFGFSRTFHLRRRPSTVPLHEGSRPPDGLPAQSGSFTSISNLARPQPNGLTMHFRPPGSRPLQQDDVSPEGAAAGDQAGPSPPPRFRIPRGTEGSSNDGSRTDASTRQVDDHLSQPTNKVVKDPRPDSEKRRKKKEKHRHQEDRHANGLPEPSRVGHINDPNESSPNVERSQEGHTKRPRDRGASSRPAKEQAGEADAERSKRKKRKQRGC